MSKVKKTLDRVLRGTSDANINFEDLCTLLRHLGFAERIRGGHHIFSRDGVPEILNLQPRGSEAKSYQIRQVRGVIVTHELAGESEEAAPAGETTEKPPGESPGVSPPEEKKDDG